MSRKPKFKPEITRVKLDPEQAVLQCNCYTNQIRHAYSCQVGGGQYTVCKYTYVAAKATSRRSSPGNSYHGSS